MNNFWIFKIQCETKSYVNFLQSSYREFCVQYETQYEAVLVLKRSYSYVFVVRVGTTSYQYDLVLVRPRTGTTSYF